MTDLVPEIPIRDGEVVLDASSGLLGAVVVRHHAHAGMGVDGVSATPPPRVVDHSFHHHHHPRHAVAATVSSANQYQSAVARAARSAALRNRLPRTQMDFYARRLTQR